VKTAFLCLAHTLIIVMSRVNWELKYTSYSKGRYLKQSFQGLLSASGLVLTNREGVNENKHSELSFGLQNYCVWWFNSDTVIFSGNSRSNKKLYL
jgi:hypothetical protein